MSHPPSPRTAGRFETLLLPAIILQSVLIGGGYSTGREVVEYAGRFGSRGWWSVLVIFLGFSLMSVLSFELARVARAYDYKKWVRELIGPFWPLFDVLLVVMVMLVIAVMMSAVGTVLEQTLGIPSMLGISVAVGVVAALNYFGTGVIERFKTWGTLALYIGYVVFALLVIRGREATPEAVTESSSTSLGAVLLAGALYVGYNLSVYPTALFALHRQTRRSETVISGILAGLLMTLPFVLTLICILRMGAPESILAAEVPWLVMLEGLGGRWVVPFFGAVVGWTLVETSVGSIHALLERVDRHGDDMPHWVVPAAGMTARRRAVLTAGLLVGAVVLSRVGIIALVATGYGLLAWGFIFLLALPMLTVGVRRILRG